MGPFLQRNMEILCADAGLAAGKEMLQREFRNFVIEQQFVTASRINAGAAVAHYYRAITLLLWIDPDAEAERIWPAENAHAIATELIISAEEGRLPHPA